MGADEVDGEARRVDVNMAEQEELKPLASLTTYRLKFYSVRGTISRPMLYIKVRLAELKLTTSAAMRSEKLSKDGKPVVLYGLDQQFEFLSWPEGAVMAFSLWEQKLPKNVFLGEAAIVNPLTNKDTLRAVINFKLEKGGVGESATLGVKLYKHTGTPLPTMLPNISALDPLAYANPQAGIVWTSVSEEKARQVLDSLKRPQPERQLPEKIGKRDFEYMSILGKGSFGKVVRVRWKGSSKEQKWAGAEAQFEGNQYAMKIIEAARVVEDNDIKSEIRILRLLSGHPFIVGYQRSFGDDKHICIVMDLVSGPTLDSVIATFRKRKYGAVQVPLYEQMTRHWAAEILLALGHMHQNNIIYRDLKPDNVLLDENGHVRLCDLGVAFVMKKKDVKSDTVERDEPNLEIGGSGYKAPEMLRKENYSFQVDFWALGCVLYYVLSGSHPFKGGFMSLFHDKDRAVQKMVMKKEVLKPVKFISPQAMDLLTRLLEPDSTKRLGANGVIEVMVHPFFGSLDWDMLIAKRFQNVHAVAPIPELQSSHIHPSKDEVPEFKDMQDAMATIDSQDVVLQLERQAL